MTTEERKEYRKRWKAEHREQEAANNKRWYALHREQHAAYNKRWYAEHRDEQVANAKRWKSADSASIYQITNTVTGQRYIGSTIMKPQARWLAHLGDIKRYRHRPLYADMQKQGVDDFKFEVLFTTPKYQARKAEQFIMDAFGGDLYNKVRAIRIL